MSSLVGFELHISYSTKCTTKVNVCNRNIFLFCPDSVLAFIDPSKLVQCGTPSHEANTLPTCKEPHSHYRASSCRIIEILDRKTTAVKLAVV